MKSKSWVNWLQSYFSLNFYQKNTQNVDQKVNKRQNTVCLEQQICASSEVMVMLETYRKSSLYYMQMCSDIHIYF